MDVDHRMLSEFSEVQLVECLLEASSEIPMDVLDKDPHPSDLTLALLSNAVYTEKTTRDTLTDYENRLDLPEGWRLMTVASNRDWTNGYFGAAFVHKGLQQVVVAHRGTLLSNTGALFTDAIGICWNQYTGCMNSAVTFVDQVRQVVHLVNSKHGRFYNLVLTGHSLGGWLAQITAFSVKYVTVSNGALIKNTSGGLHSKTVAFDSPGAKDMLYKIQDEHYTRYGTDFFDRLGRLDVTIYVSAPNRINTCGAHLRTVYRIFINLSEYKWEDIETGLYNLKTHAISNFIEAFKKSLPNVSKVLDWAKDNNEYISLFKNQRLNQANNYHVDLENNKREYFFEELKKRYEVAPFESEPEDKINVKSNLNVFSEDEVDILNYLTIVQNHMDVRVLNEFLIFKKLEIKDAFFLPNFQINNNNQTISCESKQLLGALTRRLKQLMRWLKPEFTEVVRKQITAFPRAVDLFSRAEGQSFLDALPKSSLDFADSLGLQDFLVSATERVLSILTQDGAFEMIRLRNIFFQVKENIKMYAPNNIYIGETRYTFIDWSRLRKLYDIYNSPINQNDLMMVDGSSSSNITSELRTFLNDYLKCSSANMKKLVFISSHPIDMFNSSKNIKTINDDRNINLVDLSSESQNFLRCRPLISTGNTVNYSFQDFLGVNCSISDINHFLSSDCFKKIATSEDFVLVLKDTRPMTSDLQMSVIKTNIVTKKEYVVYCSNLPNTLLVISGLNREDLETGAGWDQLAGKNIILAEKEVELFFKDTCNKNQHKCIYLFEVSGDDKVDVHCKQIYNRGFYVPRKFVHRASLNVRKISKTKHTDDLFVISSEEQKTSLLEMIEEGKEREALRKKVLIAANKEQEENIVQKYSNKNIHFVKMGERDQLNESVESLGSCDDSDESDEGSAFIDSDDSGRWEERIEKYQRGEVEWRYSHGSVKSLYPCLSANRCKPIDELTLSRTERNFVIITDKPGMGKTTSLANLSRLIESSWVIHIELKKFQKHLDNLSEKLTPQNVATFLLSEYCSSADNGLAYKLLVYLLQTKSCFKRVVLTVDGFDELDDYTKNKETSKDKLVKLFAFLQSKPTIKLFLTARKYLKKSLERNLNQFSSSFVRINAQEQQHFLFMFWRSFLPLELGINQEEAEAQLNAYAAEVLRQTKKVLGPDMDHFMGIPLQLRMLAEVCRPQSDQLIESPEVLFTRIKILSTSNLYKKFINLKYQIYIHDKTLIGKALDDDDINKKYLEPSTEMHGKLGFKTLFPLFYDKNISPITNPELIKLNRIGLIQSKGNGEYQFIHRTFAEYCCAQMVVQWMNQEERLPQDSAFKYQLIKEILLPKILLHPDSKVIRLFMNFELGEIAMSETTLKINAEHISRLWIEENAKFRNQEHQTALHIAVQEKNEHIVQFLLSGLRIENTQEAFISLITQYDNNNHTALRILDKPKFSGFTEDDKLCNRIMENILQFIHVDMCSHETRENILFSCLFNGDISKSYVSKFIRKSGNEIVGTRLLKKIAMRIRTFELEISSFMDALHRNDIQRTREILTERLINNIERSSLLLMKHKDHGMKTVLHLAAQGGYLNIVQLLAEQSYIPFNLLMTRLDDDKKTPLLTAAECGHLDIFKYLAECCADISAHGTTSALMLAAGSGHVPIVEYLINSCANIVNSSNERGETAQHLSALQGHLPVIMYLLKSGADVNCTDNEGQTVLHLAAHKGHLPIVEYLVKFGADVNSTNKRRETALHSATWTGHLSIVKHLINSDADVSSKNKFGKTALHVALRQGHLPIVKYLIESNADLSSSSKHVFFPLFEAIQGGRLQVVEHLVKSGADMKSTLNNGETAVHVAVSKGYLPIVEYLIKSGADVNSTNNNGQTPLHAAARKGHLPIVECVVKNGADINARDNIGRTALYVSAQNRHLRIIEYLCKIGADINSSKNDGWTVLHVAALTGHLPVIEYLVKSGVQINTTCIEGWTALRISAQEGHLRSIEYLVKSGADINFVKNNSWSALLLAAERGHLLVVEYLVKNGADINSTKDDGRTALHVTAWKGHLPVIKYLVQSGVILDAIDIDGWTALHVAVMKGHLPITEFLLQNGANVHSTINDGWTALHFAAWEGHLPIIEYLAKNGVDLNSTNNNNGLTAFYLAGLRGHLPVIEYLVKNGVKTNTKYIYGWTALLLAAEWGHLPVIEYLVKNGADINSTKDDGRTALHVAAWEGHLPVIEYLIESGVQTNTTDFEGWTALHFAAQEGRLLIIEHLVKSGANVNSANNNGATALHVATLKGHLPIIEYLLQSGADVNSTENYGLTALHVATQMGFLSIVKYLLQQEVDLDRITSGGWTALAIAEWSEKWDVVHVLRNRGAGDMQKNNKRL